MSFPLCASLHCSPLCCGCTTLFGVRCNGKASFSDTTGSHHWRCVCKRVCMPLCMCLYIAYVCACMKFYGFVPSLSQGVHTATVFEPVCLNQFSELVSRNSSCSHCSCGTGLGHMRSHTHQSSTEMMDPFLVVWAKMALLHRAKNHHFLSVSI